MLLVRTLTDTSDVDEARTTLTKLAEFLSDNPIRKEDLGQEGSGCPQALLRASSLWGKSDPTIARQFLTAVALLNKTRDDPSDVANRETLGRLGACEVVYDLLHEWRTRDSEVITACFEAIFTLARDAQNRKRFGNLGACESVAEALLKWGDSSSQATAWAGCKAALNLACDDGNQALLGAAGCCEIIPRILKKFASSSVEIAWDGSWAISNLAFEDQNKRRLGKAGAVEAVVAVMKAWPESREVALNACCALHNLAYTKDNFEALREARACERVVDVLEKFLDDEELLESALWTLWVMAFHPYNETTLTTSKVLLLIARTLQTAGRTSRIVAWHGCGAIWAIICSYARHWDAAFNKDLSSLLKREVLPAVRACTWNGMQNEAKAACAELVKVELPSTFIGSNADAKFDRRKSEGKPISKEMATMRTSILFRACVQEDWGSAALLLEICSKEELDYISPENGWTVLHAAVYNNGPVKLVRRCMELMDPARVDERGASVIFTACAKDVSPQLLELLLEDKRLDVTKPTLMGWTPLHVAAFLGCKSETFELLIKYGAKDSSVRPQVAKLEDEDEDSETRSSSGTVPTVLQLVATGTVNDLKVVKLLLKTGESQIDRGTLERAAKHQHLGMLEYLLQIQTLTALLSVYVVKRKKTSSPSASKLIMLPRDLIRSLSEFLYGSLTIRNE